MELELLPWLIRRSVHRPWALLAFVGMLAGIPLFPLVAGWSVRTEVVSVQAVTLELTFMWCVLGGLLALGGLAEIRPQLERMQLRRRWRIRGVVIASAMWFPALTIWLVGVILTREQGALAHITWPAALTLGLAGGLVLVVDRTMPDIVRSISYVALAWWIPAVLPEFVVGPGRWIVELGAARPFAGSGPESAVWSAGIASMVGLVLLALALDLTPRRAS